MIICLVIDKESQKNCVLTSFAVAMVTTYVDKIIMAYRPILNCKFVNQNPDLIHFSQSLLTLCLFVLAFVYRVSVHLPDGTVAWKV